MEYCAIAVEQSLAAYTLETDNSAVTAAVNLVVPVSINAADIVMMAIQLTVGAGKRM